MISTLVLLLFAAIFAHQTSARIGARPPSLKSHLTNSPNKYFHESSFSHHYSSQFSTGPLPYADLPSNLSALTGSYLFATTHLMNATTWLVHGSLLGWWWSGSTMPWDGDVDFMVDEATMRTFATRHNMSKWEFQLEEGKEATRTYLLDVNPHWEERVTGGENMIDARWIDTHSGLFIDITTLRFKNDTEVDEDGERTGEEMVVKDGHHYTYDDVFPLRETEFDGVPARIPFAYPEILVEEYGQESLVNVYYDKHVFDEEKGRWVPHLAPPLGEDARGPRKKVGRY